MSIDSEEILFTLNKSGTNNTGIEVFHIADCCRACLRIECTLTTTDSCDEDTIKFYDKLNACISEIEWLKEGFPTFICSSCISQLRIAYEFRKVCLQSNQTLVRCLSQLHEECDEGVKINVIAKPNLATTKYVLSMPEGEEHVIDDNKDIQIETSPTNSEYIHLKHFLDNEEDLNSKLETNLNINIESEVKTSVESNVTTYEVGQHVLRVEDIQMFELQPESVEEELEDNPSPVKLDQTSETRSNIKIVCMKSTTPHKTIPRVDASIHNSLICSICNKSYKKKVNLRIHMRTHTGIDILSL